MTKRIVVAYREDTPEKNLPWLHNFSCTIGTDAGWKFAESGKPVRKSATRRSVVGSFTILDDKEAEKIQSYIDKGGFHAQIIDPEHYILLGKVMDLELLQTAPEMKVRSGKRYTYLARDTEPKDTKTFFRAVDHDGEEERAAQKIIQEKLNEQLEQHLQDCHTRNKSRRD